MSSEFRERNLEVTSSVELSEDEYNPETPCSYYSKSDKDFLDSPKLNSTENADVDGEEEKGYFWQYHPRKKDSADRFLRIAAMEEQISQADKDERVDFHRNFQVVVVGTAGQKPTRDKEIQDGLVGSERASYGETLWLHLQAFWSGKPMKKKTEIQNSTNFHQKWLEIQRNNGQDILDEIRIFKHSPFRMSDSSFYLPESSPQPAEEEEEPSELEHPGRVTFESGNSVPEEDSDSQNADAGKIMASPHPGEMEIFKNEFLERQRFAVTEVGNLINKYEKYLELFPTTKCMKNYLGEEFDESLENRISVLYVWLNVTQDLCMKIRDVGRMLGMERFCEERLQTLVVSDWPNLDFLPRNKPNYASYHSVSEETTAVITKDVVYKKFVEKSVRLRGMRKVLANLAKIVEKSLQKAREALEKPVVAKGENAFVFSSEQLQHAPRLREVRRKETFGLSFSDSPFPHIVEPSKKESIDSPKMIEPYQTIATNQQPSEAPSDSLEHLSLFKQYLADVESELTTYGVRNPIYESLNLPSFYPSFLFLLRVPLDLVHHWLHLRVEQKAITEPDPLTLKTLIQDCRDCLEAAVEVKCFYYNYVRGTTNDEEQLDKLLFKDLSAFESDLVDMFQIYLGYVRSWFEVHSNVDYKTKDWGPVLLEKAKEEWKFAKKIAINVLSGESDAACQFCNFAKLMLEQMVGNYLVTACDKHRMELFEKSEEEDLEEEDEGEEEEEAGGRRGAGSSSYSAEDEQEGEEICSGEITLEVPSMNDSLASNSNSKQSSVFLACKWFKDVIGEVRERALRAMNFAKLLRADLEISAKFELNLNLNPIEAFLEKLKNSGHVLITTVRSTDEFLMFCDAAAAENDDYLRLLLNITCGRDINEIPKTLSENFGYLVLLNTNNQIDRSRWSGMRKHLVLDADTDVALHYVQVDAVYLVVVNSQSLAKETEAFLLSVGKNSVNILEPQCSCHEIVAYNMDQLKGCALNVRQTISERLKIMKDQLLEKEYEEMDENSVEETPEHRNFDDKEMQIYRDSLIQAFNFAFEYQRELARLMNNQFKANLAYGMHNFVEQWKEFLLNNCPTKKEGVAPRWTQEGLQFMALAIHPTFTVYLPNEEFQKLKRNVEKCEAHIFGNIQVIQIPTSQLSGGGYVTIFNTGSMTSLSRTAEAFREENERNPFWPNPSGRRSQSMTIIESNKSEQTDSDSEKGKVQIVYATEDPRSRIQNVLFQQEESRQKKLQTDRRIGRCVSQEQVEPVAHFTGKRVSFRWSRMEKMIGRGASGTVYKGYNMDAKKLMAVKQISYERGNYATMHALIDEISNFERLNHPNLVKYYGVEAHSDELLIFMEYCDGGTLESVCREGLDPILIRQYTHFLLRGINDLHEHLIVHRDIKPGNVFLTSGKEVLKLGDFGSSVRLKNTVTFTGELSCNVGTPAYMAPEVITGGHQGRASDIWSLGCVVLEMATGKPPWHDLANPTQIIWRVGSGYSPRIPEKVSPYCRDFLSKCFQNSPELRWTANRLIDHPFAKVDTLVDGVSQS